MYTPLELSKYSDKELEQLMAEIQSGNSQSSAETAQRPSVLSQALQAIGGKEGGSSGLSGLKDLLGTGSTSSSTSALTTPTSLPASTQLSNLSQGLPGNGVATGLDGSTVLADGSTAGAFSPQGFGSAGNMLAPALGAYGTYDLLKNKRRGVRAPLQGAASGALIGSSVGGLPGAVIGGTIGFGVGLAQAGKSTKEKQQDRWGGVDKKEFGKSMEGYDYGSKNEDFKRTRDEKYLTADDIRVNPDNYNNVSDWDTWDKKNQDLFLNDMLSKGKVNEKKGGIYYDDDYAKNVAEQIRTGKYQAPAPQAIPAGVSLVKQLPAGTVPMIPKSNATTDKIKDKFNKFTKK